MFGAVNVVDSHGAVIDTKRQWNTDRFFPAGELLESLLFGCIVSPPSLMVRKSCASKAGPFRTDLTWGHDWEWVLRLSQVDAAGYGGEPLAAYRVHEASGTAEILRAATNGSQERRILKETFARLSVEDRRWSALSRAAFQALSRRHMYFAELGLLGGQRAVARNNLYYAARADLIHDDASDLLGIVPKFYRVNQAVCAISRATQRSASVRQSVVKDTKLSVIIPTHNRSEKLDKLLACLRRQNLAATEYEIIIVDDNSVPPVVLQASANEPRMTLVRLDEKERSAARNTGAAIATGEWLVFLDDDMTVENDFLSCHLSAHGQWRNALVVGSIRLPDETTLTPFGRFRQKLEDQGLPRGPGLASMPNFCTAANMSLARAAFLGIGGFDSAIISGEDQDFALRHTTRGGQIVFWPEARAIHWDSSLDIRRFCLRNEWGSGEMIPFCQRHPDWPDNIERHKVNGPLQFGREPFKQSFRKVIKSMLALKPVRETLFFIAGCFRTCSPEELRA